MKIDKTYTSMSLRSVGYTKETEDELRHTLEQQGFEFHQTFSSIELGSVIPQFVAQLSFSVNSVFGIVALNLLSSTIYDTLKKIRAVMLKHKAQRTGEERPKVEISITGEGLQEGDKTLIPVIKVQFFADVDNSQAAILQALETAKRAHIVAFEPDVMEQEISRIKAEYAHLKKRFKRAVILQRYG